MPQPGPDGNKGRDSNSSGFRPKKVSKVSSAPDDSFSLGSFGRSGSIPKVGSGGRNSTASASSTLSGFSGGKARKSVMDGARGVRKSVMGAARKSIVNMGGRVSLFRSGKRMSGRPEGASLRREERARRIPPEYMASAVDAAAEAKEQYLSHKSKAKVGSALKGGRKSIFARGKKRNSKLAVKENFLALNRTLPGLTPEERSELQEKGETREYRRGDQVVKRHGDALCIVVAGQVLATDWRGQETLRTEGTLFDRMLFKTVTHSEEVLLLVISQELVDQIDSHIRKVLLRELVKTVLNDHIEHMTEAGQLSFFKQLNNWQQDSFIDGLQKHTVQPGGIVAARGDVAPFVLVLEGEISAHEERFGAGTCFGTRQFLECGQLDDNVVALVQTSMYVMYQDCADRIFKQPLNEVIHSNKIKEVLLHSCAFQHLSDDDLDGIVAAFQERVYYNGQAIIREGDEGSEFFLIQTGGVSIWIQGKKVRTLTAWDYFGERAIIRGDPCSATCKAEGSCLCLVLDAERFVSIAGELRHLMEERMYMQDQTFEVENMRASAIMGSGWLGNVCLAHRTDDEYTQFAVKSISKRKVKFKREREALLLERETCTDLFHVCIAHFVRSMQDDQNIYFIAEFLDGGDLYQLMRETRQFTKEQVQFYVASIALALEYLHGCNIMHRDLRPEHVLIDSAGNAKLSGFGCCRRYDLKHINRREKQVKTQNKHEAPSPSASATQYRSEPAPKQKDPGYMAQMKRAATRAVSNAEQGGKEAKSEAPKPQSDHIVKVKSETAKAKSDHVVNGAQDVAAKKAGDGPAKTAGQKKAAAGVCKKDEKDAPKDDVFRADTIVGSPEYLAPEIILGDGYTAAVDWWSLGIIMYELIAGYLPFGQKKVKMTKLFIEILEAPLMFPEHLNDDLSQSCLTSRLLERTPGWRLVSTKGTRLIEAHSYFRGFDWKALAARSMDPPCQPSQDNVRDKWTFHDAVNLSTIAEESAGRDTPRTSDMSDMVNPMSSTASDDEDLWCKVF